MKIAEILINASVSESQQFMLSLWPDQSPNYLVLFYTLIGVGVTTIQLFWLKRRGQLGKNCSAWLARCPSDLALAVSSGLCCAIDSYRHSDDFAQLGCWLIFCTSGLVLAVSDWYTTWIPTKLTILTGSTLFLFTLGGKAIQLWLHISEQMLGSATFDKLIALFAGTTRSLVCPLAGALLGFSIFSTVWLASSDLGFGDVIFAAFVGWIGGLYNLYQPLYMLAAGSFLGVTYGLVVKICARLSRQNIVQDDSKSGSGFGLIPALWLGSFLVGMW